MVVNRRQSRSSSLKAVIGRLKTSVLDGDTFILGTSPSACFCCCCCIMDFFSAASFWRSSAIFKRFWTADTWKIFTLSFLISLRNSEYFSVPSLWQDEKNLSPCTLSLQKSLQSCPFFKTVISIIRFRRFPHSKSAIANYSLCTSARWVRSDLTKSLRISFYFINFQKFQSGYVIRESPFLTHKTRLDIFMFFGSISTKSFTSTNAWTSWQVILVPTTLPVTFTSRAIYLLRFSLKDSLLLLMNVLQLLVLKLPFATLWKLWKLR